MGFRDGRCCKPCRHSKGPTLVRSVPNPCRSRRVPGTTGTTLLLANSGGGACPVRFVDEFEGGGQTKLLGTDRARCTLLQPQWPHAIWTTKALALMDAPTNQGALRSIWNGLRRARMTRINCLEVADEALTAATSREAESVGGENVTNVENLFKRSNRGGTPLDGDGLVLLFNAEGTLAKA